MASDGSGGETARALPSLDRLRRRPTRRARAPPIGIELAVVCGAARVRHRLQTVTREATPPGWRRACPRRALLVEVEQAAALPAGPRGHSAVVAAPTRRLGPHARPRRARLVGVEQPAARPAGPGGHSAVVAAPADRLRLHTRPRRALLVGKERAAARVRCGREHAAAVAAVAGQ